LLEEDSDPSFFPFGFPSFSFRGVNLSNCPFSSFFSCSFFRMVVRFEGEGMAPVFFLNTVVPSDPPSSGSLPYILRPRCDPAWSAASPQKAPPSVAAERQVGPEALRHLFLRGLRRRRRWISVVFSSDRIRLADCPLVAFFPLVCTSPFCLL